MEQQESFSSVDPFHEKSQEKAHNCCFYIHLKGRKRTNNWRWFSKISSSSSGIKCWKQKGYNVRALVKKYESMSSLNFQLKRFKGWVKYFTVVCIRNHDLNYWIIWLWSKESVDGISTILFIAHTLMTVPYLATNPKSHTNITLNTHALIPVIRAYKLEFKAKH